MARERFDVGIGLLRFTPGRQVQATAVPAWGIDAEPSQSDRDDADADPDAPGRRAPRGIRQ